MSDPVTIIIPYWLLLIIGVMSFVSLVFSGLTVFYKWRISHYEKLSANILGDMQHKIEEKVSKEIIKDRKSKGSVSVSVPAKKKAVKREK